MQTVVNDRRGSRNFVRGSRSDQGLIRVGLLWIIGIVRLAILDPGTFGFILDVSFLGREQDMIAPAPPHQLAQLLEYQQIQDPPGSHFIVVVVGHPIPMEAFQGLGQRDDEGDG